ncbi:MAG: hypothetical protein ACAH12_00115 [Methylophilaceae bacterium]
MALFTKIILCVSGNQLTAGVWTLRKLQSFQVFEHTEQGKQDFGSFLQQYPNTKIHLLVDSVEEDYRLENLPHTFGGARRELVDRKLGQLYRNLVFRAAHFINREKTKRKDDRFLFFALSKADFIVCWIDIIEAQQAPLAGVYMLSMLSQAIVKRMRLTQPHIILSERLNSGLRQTYLHHGHLRISRLAPINADAENRLGYFYLVETEKTRLYLISQKFVARDTALNMVLPSLDTEGSKVICRNIEQEQGIECERLDLAELARSVKFEANLLKNNPELLHMHLLAIGHVPDNLAPSNFIKQHQVNVVRQSINVATAMVCLGGLLFCGMYLKQASDFVAETQQAAADTRIQEQRYNEVAKDFPSTPIPSADLELVVEAHQSIKPYIKTPNRMMAIVSSAMSGLPEIQINRLRWLQTNDTNIKDNDASVTNQVTSDVAAATTSNFIPDPTIMYETGFINGELRNFTGDYRAALNSVNKLAEQLKANPAVVKVEILQAPVNVSSYTNLQGSTNDEKTSLQSAALFKLKIILKQEVPAA